MSMGMAFWIVMLVWVVWGGAAAWRDGWVGVPINVLFLLLFGLLGWATFGPPIH